MKALKELRQQLHDLKAQGSRLLKLADAEGRDLTDDEEARYTEIETELKTVADDIAVAEKMNERRRLMGTTVITQNSQITVNDDDPLITAGFDNLAQFAVAVHNASGPSAAIDPRLGILGAASDAMEGGGSVGEGFMLPRQFRDDIWALVTQLDGIFNLTDLEPTEARQIDFIADETTPWGSSGVQANWRAEGAQMTASKQATSGRSLYLNELYALVLATEELLEDAPRLQSRLTFKAAQAISWKVDDAVIYGNGAGKPQGWFTSAALVSIAKEASQTADTIVTQNVLKMFARLLVVPGDSPFWLAHRTIVPQLATMTIGNQPVWLAPNGLMASPGGTLLGLPVRLSEQAKTLGDKGDLQLVSPKGYYAAHRTQGVKFDTSMHLYFDYNIQAFRWIFRFGGQPYLSAPLAAANGPDTRSHFVTLDERV